MKSKLDDYITDLETDIEQMQRKLDGLKGRLIKWGKGSEIKMLEFIIPRKKELLEEVRRYKSELVSFKE